MKSYSQFFEGRISRISYDKAFYLKQIDTSENGKMGLFEFKIKDIKKQLWIPLKAIYSTSENGLPDLLKDYKKIRLAHFIYDPDRSDRNYKKKRDFFDNYTKYIDPIISKQSEKNIKISEDKAIESFKEAIDKMIPEVEIYEFDRESNSIKTSIGDFYIYSKNPIGFKIGDIFLKMSKDGIDLNYKNQFTLKALGKDGLIAKALIKINSGQILNAVEKMALKRIYIETLKHHDWYYHMSDDRRSYQSGSEQAMRISNLKKILTEVGEGKAAQDLYDQYKQ